MQSQSIQNRNESYIKVLPELKGRRNEVFIALSDHPEGLTGREIAKLIHIEKYQVLPRLTELRNIGLVVECGTKYDEVVDRNVTIWKVIKQVGDADDVKGESKEVAHTVFKREGVVMPPLPVLFTDDGQGVFI